MTAPNPSYVQVAVDGSGKKIQNLENVVPVPATGAENTVQTQVVALADRGGSVLQTEPASEETAQAILEELREIKTILLMALSGKPT